MFSGPVLFYKGGGHILEINKIYNMDCLEGMKLIDDKSINMILCDLPYGTTMNKWDSIIPFELIWIQYERIIKDNGAIILTADQPFTTYLIYSNPSIFRYRWVWIKDYVTGFLNAKRMPLKNTEDVLVFYKSLPTYNPQGIKMVKKIKVNQSQREGYGKIREGKYMQESEDHPTQVLVFGKDAETIHPTQKPVALFEYLIRTYTNKGDNVLDNCMGSGTTAIACIKTERNYIGFELNAEYHSIAEKRVLNAKYHNEALGVQLFEMN